ncbi:MAG: hypothetical protein MJZ79_03110 [Paludibacteraceae bacterium]|nr:hypothetical protein [Paludibacteraceae bacterium]
MEYKTSFRDLIDDPAWQGKYVGQGNPNAKILLIGQECAFDRDSKQYELEFAPNFTIWTKNVKNNVGFEDLSPDYWIDQKYNPLFPYRSPAQTFKVLTFDKNKNPRSKTGTSRTWRNYQLLIDTIRLKRQEISHLHKYDTPLDFFEHCFITEMSDFCIENHKNLDAGKAKVIRERIALRSQLIRSSLFFKTFDVVILACGGYADKLCDSDGSYHSMFGDAIIIGGVGNHLPQMSRIGNAQIQNIVSEYLK